MDRESNRVDWLSVAEEFGLEVKKRALFSRRATRLVGHVDEFDLRVERFLGEGANHSSCRLTMSSAPWEEPRMFIRQGVTERQRRRSRFQTGDEEFDSTFLVLCSGPGSRDASMADKVDGYLTERRRRALLDLASAEPFGGLTVGPQGLPFLSSHQVVILEVNQQKRPADVVIARSLQNLIACAKDLSRG